MQSQKAWSSVHVNTAKHFKSKENRKMFVRDLYNINESQKFSILSLNIQLFWYRYAIPADYLTTMFYHRLTVYFSLTGHVRYF